ncbi:Rpn family recombination-promoting nuclease/putative transposase [Caldifermentibacillus hisashii]|uniref:Rpn family recombination-promoting nuclease/putative transposase n=1 Tax=Caldifermentibacillus hisashii TaxID=996558 RepID=UPI003BEF0D95
MNLPVINIRCQYFICCLEKRCAIRASEIQKYGYLYFLFEHKSYPDKGISLQLLKYMVEIWEAKIKKTRASEPLGESRAVVHRKNIKFFRLRCNPSKLSLCTYALGK